MPKHPGLRFPTHFLWGVSTSAHQVEGGNHNQWTVWELENAQALAAQASYQYDDLNNWNDIKKAAKSPTNYVSGNAADHYKLYESDFSLVRALNMNAFRFSLEWSRVQPEEGAWNSQEVQHYKDYLLALKKRGIEPIITLFQFTLPVWFADKGGFEKRGNIKAYLSFVDRILDELGSSARYIITMHEPENYVTQSYLKARWPPQVHNKWRALRVLHNLAYAHNKAADIIHAKSRRYKVSIAKNAVFTYPGDDAWLSERSTEIAHYVQDDYFLKRVIKHCDFIGVNYYCSMRVYGYRLHSLESEVSDTGVPMQPANLQFVLERLYRKYKKPIMITDNGVADRDDSSREWWLTQTVLAMHKAMGNGVQLLGYIHYSLLDNFEWDNGYWPAYGLFGIDRDTMKRYPRQSARWFGRAIKKLRA